MTLRLAVFDMDGVLIPAIGSWALLHRAFGTTNHDNLEAFTRGEIDDSEFIRRDIGKWLTARGKIHHDEVVRVLEKIAHDPAAVDVFRMLREAGVRTAIISGGLEPLVSRIGRILSADHVHYNSLEVDAHGFLTGHGKVGVPLRRKSEIVAMLRRQCGAEREEVIAFGDTEFDVSMFDEAGIGVAVDPKDETIRRAASVIFPGLSQAVPFVDSLLTGARRVKRRNT